MDCARSMPRRKSRPRFVAACRRSISGAIAAASSRAYQTSRLPIRGEPRASPRGRRARSSSTASRRARAGSPMSRPAISTLAASRLTSHSHGPRAVSSKSLMSNTSERSGDGEAAEVGDVRIAAQLDLDAGHRRRGEVGGHHRRRAPVEGERRGEHARVAQRQQLLEPARLFARAACSTVERRPGEGAQSAWALRGACLRAARPWPARVEGASEAATAQPVSSSRRSARMILAAASSSARCENALGKLPRWRPVAVSNSSA